MMRSSAKMRPLIDYSQYGQPAFFRQFLPPEAPRLVVDVGAHDGVDGSNSRELILEGWSAILFEPLPLVFAQLQSHYSGSGRVRMHPWACSNVCGRSRFFIGKDGAGGQTSSLSGEQQWQHNHSGQEIELEVRTLTSALESDACPSTFGLLLVDAEGMDLEVLRGLDFERFRPAAICTEEYQGNPEKDGQKYAFLKSQGYRMRGVVGSDSIWTCSRLVGDRCWPAETRGYRGQDLPVEVSNLPAAGTGTVHIDKSSLDHGKFEISGWAFSAFGRAPENVLVGLGSSKCVTEYIQAARFPRADVARHFSDPGLFMSGFRVSAEIASIPDWISIVQEDGRARHESRYGLNSNGSVTES